jgi:hypothetical protein
MSEAQYTRPVKGQQLYRLYDADGELLYIGISYSAIARFAKHKQTQPWIDDVCRIEIESHEVDRWEIEAMEIAAIQAERPRHNVIRNGGHNRRDPGRAIAFNHSWPAYHRDMVDLYWSVQRDTAALVSKLSEVPGAEIRRLFDEMWQALDYPDMHHECPYHDTVALMPIEHPFARLDDGMCVYDCRVCGGQWRCWYK